LSPKNFLLLPAGFNLIPEDLLLMRLLIYPAFQDESLLKRIHLLLQPFAVLKNVAKLCMIPDFDNLF